MIPWGGNSFELVVVVSNIVQPTALVATGIDGLVQSNENSRPSMINTQVDGVDAWSTSDLFVEHPTKRGYWKVFGRTDDQIMHSTGEKVSVTCIARSQISSR